MIFKKKFYVFNYHNLLFKKKFSESYSMNLRYDYVVNAIITKNNFSPCYIYN